MNELETDYNIVKEGYKQTKLGWIPNEWCIAQLKDVAIFNPKTGELPEKFIYIDLESVKRGNLIKENEINLSEAPSRAQRLLKYEDILFQTVRPYQKNNLFFKKSGNYVASSGYAQLRAEDCPGFVFQLIFAQYINNQVMARCTGTSFPAISAKDLSKVNIKLPPLIEQRKIASILNTWDKAIAVQEKLISQKQAFKKGLMQQLLTGKKRFTGFEGEWEDSLVGEIASIKTGNSDTQDKIENGKYPFFVRSNKIERINRYSFDGEAVLTSGDGVGVGKIYHYLNEKFDYHQRVYNIHNFKPVVDGKFFFYFFSKNFYRRVVAMSAKNSVDSVRMDMISKMPIYLPALAEQKKIAMILSNCDFEIENLVNYKARLIEQKQGLMKQLLTGKKRVKL